MIKPAKYINVEFLFRMHNPKPLSTKMSQSIFNHLLFYRQPLKDLMNLRPKVWLTRKTQNSKFNEYYNKLLKENIINAK
jgi:hypothetical protein